MLVISSACEKDIFFKPMQPVINCIAEREYINFSRLCFHTNLSKSMFFKLTAVLYSIEAKIFVLVIFTLSANANPFIASFAFVLQTHRAKPIPLCRAGAPRPTLRFHYNTNRQRKQSLCRNLFVGATIGRQFWFCGCLRAINDRPYEESKHPYENQPKRPFCICFC